jgi:hypothetical protein
VDDDLSGGFGLAVVGSFDELPASTVRADERDEMCGVDRASAVRCGFDELERHRQPGCV